MVADNRSAVEASEMFSFSAFVRKILCSFTWSSPPIIETIFYPCLHVFGLSNASKILIVQEEFGVFTISAFWDLNLSSFVSDTILVTGDASCQGSEWLVVCYSVIYFIFPLESRD